jgi:hypothetical protein
MKLTANVVTRLEVPMPSNIEELLKDKCFYRWTYSEFNNEIYFPRSSITDASEEFRQTEIYQALKEVFDQHPTAYEIFLV